MLGFIIVLGFFCAAFTEGIGIHAIFGAFIAGVVLGDSAHMQQHTRATLSQFIASVFAPLFFASIGLRMNLAANFDISLILALLVIACVGETLGSTFGARLSGFPKRQALAIGFALNARGAMQIVLALLAVQYGVIGERLFVALIVLALVTSVIAGPLMQRILRRKKTAQFRDFLTTRGFLPHLRATTSREAIGELVSAVAPGTGLAADLIAATVWQREKTMSTALPHGLAVPHARLAGLARPIVAVGISRDGVAFDSEDAIPTQLIFLILTPMDENEVQLEILADIARTFQKPDTISRAQQAGTFTQFQALVNMESALR
jgi:mannitol/fructose-specific phosphotransferase system IIA component (Ntr-type)